MLMSSSVGSSLSSFVRVTWSEQTNAQTVGRVMKLVKDGSGLILTCDRAPAAWYSSLQYTIMLSGHATEEV
jgi:hypothetical protein